jgi:hypothetical protein
MSQMTTIKVGESAKTIALPEGKALILTGSVDAAGVVYLLDPALGGTNSLKSWAVGAGALAPIGAYAGSQKVLVSCSAGSIDAVVQDAVLTQAGTGPLPIATGAQLGGIKSGPGLSIDPATGVALPPPAPTQVPAVVTVAKNIIISERVAVGTYRGVGYGFQMALKENHRVRLTVKNEIANTVVMEVGTTTAANNDFNIPGSFPLQIAPGQEAEIAYEAVQVYIQQARSGSAVLNQFVTIEREYLL